MPAILIAVAGTDAQPWEARLRALASKRDIRLWPHVGDAADIAYACAWHAPRGLFTRLPRLNAIFASVPASITSSPIAICRTCPSCASSIPISPRA